MENTDRACDRSQAGVVQSRCFGLNLNTDKLGASPHPSLPPLPAARSVPRPAGSLVAGPSFCPSLGWPLLPAGLSPAPGVCSPRGSCLRGGQQRSHSPTRPRAELEPVLGLRSPQSRPKVQQPPGHRLPCPGQKEPADLCSEPLWVRVGVSWLSKQNLCF